MFVMLKELLEDATCLIFKKHDSIHNVWASHEAKEEMFYR